VLKAGRSRAAFTSQGDEFARVLLKRCCGWSATQPRSFVKLRHYPLVQQLSFDAKFGIV